jgi:hypothetical protein
LHLGSAWRTDLLRRPALREPLLDALRDVDRLVLLGDVLELRHGPRREAMAAARALFEDLGRVFAGREVVVCAGNHDHALIEPWLARRSELEPAGALGSEQRIEVAEASPMLATLAEWAAPARVSAAYPGVWVRPDVYATHGHYLDCHLSVPMMEGLGIGATSRVLRRPAREFQGADDYEAVMGPVLAWIDAAARQSRNGNSLNGATTVRAWRALGGAGGRGQRRSLRARALAGVFPLAVATLNRAGLGPYRADVSGGELRRAGLRAMGDVAARLRLGDAHVIFGHTHRAGQLREDRAEEWTTPTGARLVNSGCWTYDSVFLTATPGESPYWPGTCVLVEDSGPPVLKRLLLDRTHAELAP